MTQIRKRTKLNPAGVLLLIHSIFLLTLFVLTLVFSDSYYQVIGTIAGILAFITAIYALVNVCYFESEIFESDEDIDYDFEIEEQYRKKEREDADRT